MLGNLGTALDYNQPQQRILVAAEFFHLKSCIKSKMIQKSREIFGAEDLLTMLDSKATLTLALTAGTFKNAFKGLTMAVLDMVSFLGVY